MSIGVPLQLHVCLSIYAEAATSSVRNSVLRNFAKFTGKHLCKSLLLKTFASWQLICVIIIEKKPCLVCLRFHLLRKLSGDIFLCSREKERLKNEWENQELWFCFTFSTLAHPMNSVVVRSFYIMKISQGGGWLTEKVENWK